MAKKKKSKKKIRTEFRKRYEGRTRKNDFTREFSDDAEGMADAQNKERVSGKGKLTRKRTITGSESEHDPNGFQVELDVDPDRCLFGRVMQVFGLASIVRVDDGREFRCTVRGILKSLVTDLQHVVVAGDGVVIQIGDFGSEEEQAVIVRVEPRRNRFAELAENDSKLSRQMLTKYSSSRARLSDAEAEFN